MRSRSTTAWASNSAAQRSAAAVLLSFAFLALSGCHAQPASTDSTLPTTPSAASALSSTQFNHRLPSVLADECTKVQVELPVKNDLGRKINFKLVHASCGACTRAELAHMTLNVAEETKLRLALDLVNRTGLQRGAVTLRDDQGAEWVHLYEFMVYPRVGFVSENPQIHWSNVEPLQPLSHELEFAAYGRKREELPADAEFRVEGGPKVEVAGSRITSEPDGFWSRRFKLKVSHIAPPQAGPITGAIVGRCAMNGKEETARLAVTGFVRSLLMVTPEYLFFAAGDGPKKVVVRRTDGKPLHLTVQPHKSEKPALKADFIGTGLVVHAEDDPTSPPPWPTYLWRPPGTFPFTPNCAQTYANCTPWSQHSCSPTLGHTGYTTCRLNGVNVGVAGAKLFHFQAIGKCQSPPEGQGTGCGEAQDIVCAIVELYAESNCATLKCYKYVKAYGSYCYV